MNFLYQDDDFVIIDKPAGFYVHPPEDHYPVSRSLICLFHVRDTLKQKVFPVHRLDVSTSGILIFAKSSEVASIICRQFANRTVHKTYKAVARGYTPEQGLIELPLESARHGEFDGRFVDARTSFQRFATMELLFPVGKYKSSRYSLLEVYPQTGRYHQIRRHFNRVAHPLIGDGTHGDSRHNTFFREVLALPGLCLRAHKISFTHPRSGAPFSLEAPSNEKWIALEALSWTPLRSAIGTVQDISAKNSVQVPAL